jgi:hypothetical protein
MKPGLSSRFRSVDRSNLLSGLSAAAISRIDADGPISRYDDAYSTHRAQQRPGWDSGCRLPTDRQASTFPVDATSSASVRPVRPLSCPPLPLAPSRSPGPPLSAPSWRPRAAGGIDQAPPRHQGGRLEEASPGGNQGPVRTSDSTGPARGAPHLGHPAADASTAIRGTRHLVPSRIIAHAVTNSRRATATIAIFFRFSLPPFTRS